MDMIEPNTGALVLFGFFACISSLAGLVMSGVFPLATRPDLAHPAGRGLITANIVLLALVLYGTVAFGLQNLRWTSMVIVGGLVVLFTPGLFNIWPGRWRDGLSGLAVILGVLAASGLGLIALR
ncbi:MAG: hypothetical protein ACK5IB_06680 [Qingshengfaniella sp.]